MACALVALTLSVLKLVVQAAGAPKMEKRRGAPAPISFFAESRGEEDSHSGTTYLNRRGSNGENKEMRRIRRSEAHPLSNVGSDDKAAGKGRLLQSVEKVAERHFFELSQVLPLAFAPGRQNLQRTKTSGFSSVLTHLSSEPDGT